MEKLGLLEDIAPFINSCVFGQITTKKMTKLSVSEKVRLIMFKDLVYMLVLSYKVLCRIFFFFFFALSRFQRLRAKMV